MFPVKKCQVVTVTKPTVTDSFCELAVVPFSFLWTLLPTGNGQNLILFNQFVHQPADNKCDEYIHAPLTKPVDTTVAVNIKNHGVGVDRSLIPVLYM